MVDQVGRLVDQVLLTRRALLRRGLHHFRGLFHDLGPDLLQTPGEQRRRVRSRGGFTWRSRITASNRSRTVGCSLIALAFFDGEMRRGFVVRAPAHGRHWLLSRQLPTSATAYPRVGRGFQPSDCGAEVPRRLAYAVDRRVRECRLSSAKARRLRDGPQTGRARTVENLLLSACSCGQVTEIWRPPRAG